MAFIYHHSLQFIVSIIFIISNFLLYYQPLLTSSFNLITVIIASPRGGGGSKPSETTHTHRVSYITTLPTTSAILTTKHRSLTSTEPPKPPLLYHTLPRPTICGWTRRLCTRLALGCLSRSQQFLAWRRAREAVLKHGDHHQSLFIKTTAKVLKRNTHLLHKKQ